MAKMFHVVKRGEQWLVVDERPATYRIFDDQQSAVLEAERLNQIVGGAAAPEEDKPLSERGFGSDRDSL
jgi:hypothetical protein